MEECCGMRIHPGDGGKTSTFTANAARVDKSYERIDAIGSVDELNAFLGVASSFCQKHTAAIPPEIENDFFTVGAELAGSAQVGITLARVERIEQNSAEVEKQLPLQTKFILPGGTPCASLLNVAQGPVARRAERSLVRLERSLSAAADARNQDFSGCCMLSDSNTSLPCCLEATSLSALRSQNEQTGSLNPCSCLLNYLNRLSLLLHLLARVENKKGNKPEENPV